jgi:outer membrane lipoprotein-sorting protein
MEGGTMRHIRTRQWIGTLAVGATLAFAPGAARGADVNDVLARMRSATEPGSDMRATVVFAIVNERGETVKWTGHLYRRRGVSPRMRVVLDDPIDLRGTEVSVAGSADGTSKTRIYLPSLRRVRQIESDMRGESFLGTDFNYEDLGLQQLDFQQHRLEDAGDASCYHVESIPSRGWWYGRIDRCIDKKDYLPRRTEYYDRNGVLWKVRTLDAVKKIGGHPTPTEITMQIIPQHTSTTITLSEVQYDTGLVDSLFAEP